MARRSFVIELDEMIVKHGVEALLKNPAEPTLLVQKAGFIQGLNAAKNLLAEITSSNLKEDDER